MSILLLDAGNTRLKWAVSDSGNWLHQGSAEYEDLSDLAPILEPGMACYIASVAHALQEKQLLSVLAPFNIEPEWLTAEARFAEVSNLYLDPVQLGVDRWVGMIAARQHTRSATLVVSAGTALTVDALSANGAFQGGVIVPGHAMMRRALQQGVARLAEVDGAWHAFPRTTEDAVESGIIASLCGAIHLQHAQLAEMAGVAPHCILTGGTAELLLPHLALSVEFVPALILEGIDCVAMRKENA